MNGWQVRQHALALQTQNWPLESIDDTAFLSVRARLQQLPAPP